MQHMLHDRMPRLLDLFCSARGSCKGYQDAGFYVVGVDKVYQPRYPGDYFIQADVLTWLPLAIETGYIDGFDVIHASPPCQEYSRTKSIHQGKYEYADLVEPVRELLKATGKPYIIENVPGSPLINPIVLCGSMFGLPLIRHRLFESSPEIWFPPAPCSCRELYTNSKAAYSSFANGATAITVGGNNYPLRDGIVAMGINWMSKKELNQAIPPSYTRWLGEQMLRAIQ